MKNNDKALNTFMALQGELEEKIKKIKDHFENPQVMPEEINWADVGEATKVLNDLKDICEFIGLGDTE